MNRQEFSSLRQGLVGAWVPSLYGGGALVREIGGVNRPATLNAGCSLTTTSGRLAIRFNGTSGKTTWGTASLVGLSAVSVSTWSYVSLSTSESVAIQQGGSETSRVFFNARASDGNSYVGGRYPSGDFYSVTTAPSAGQWNHFVGVVITGQSTSAASRLIYINGVPASSYTHVGGASPAFPSSATFLDSGERFTGSGTGWNDGWIDDVRIYNRVLTLSEIRLLASRRGIGLTPLPDRTAGMPRKLYVNVGGVWRSGDAYVNTGSGWRLGTPSVNVGGTFR